MAVITFPSDGSAIVEQFSWGQQRQDILFRSQFGAQSTELSNPLWTASLSSPTNLESASGGWQSLIMRLRGQTNQLALWNMGRPVPLGTMRGEMLLSSSYAAGATTIMFNAGVGQAFTTLKAGDMLGLGSGLTQQVVMITTDATAGFSGIITVAIEPPLRNAFSSGATVTWDKPKALFRQSDSKASWDYRINTASGFSLHLIEDIRP